MPVVSQSLCPTHTAAYSVARDGIRHITGVVTVFPVLGLERVGVAARTSPDLATLMEWHMDFLRRINTKICLAEFQNCQVTRTAKRVEKLYIFHDGMVLYEYPPYLINGNDTAPSLKLIHH